MKTQNKRNTVSKQAKEDTDLHLKCTVSVALALFPAREVHARYFYGEEQVYFDEF